jgi:hypothetical protein
MDEVCVKHLYSIIAREHAQSNRAPFTKTELYDAVKIIQRKLSGYTPVSELVEVIIAKPMGAWKKKFIMQLRAILSLPSVAACVAQERFLTVHSLLLDALCCDHRAKATSYYVCLVEDVFDDTPMYSLRLVYGVVPPPTTIVWMCEKGSEKEAMAFLLTLKTALLESQRLTMHGGSYFTGDRQHLQHVVMRCMNTSGTRASDSGSVVDIGPIEQWFAQKCQL